MAEVVGGAEQGCCKREATNTWDLLFISHRGWAAGSEWLQHESREACEWA